MKKVYFYLILMSILFLSFFLIFKQFNMKKRHQLTKEEIIERAKLIDQITAGFLMPDDEIKVIFNNDQVPLSEINKELNKNVFSFYPPISGKSFWKDRRTLIFKPEKSLKMRQKYIGFLNLKKLFDKNKLSKLQELDFEFSVIGREIIDLQMDITPIASNNRENIIMKAEVSFNMPIDLETLKKNVKFYDNGDHKKIDITKSEKENTFLIKSEKLLRTEEEKEFELLFLAQGLGISETKSEKVNVPPLNTFSVVRVNSIESKGDAYIEIHFSDEVKQPNDYKGFIKVTPNVDFKMKCEDKKVTLMGNFTLGANYQLTILKNIKSKFDTYMNDDYTTNVKIDDITPSFEFTHSGVFLPSTNKNKVTFKTVNLKKVKVEVYQVFPENICQFLQSTELKSKKNRKWGMYDLIRVGIPIYSKDLYLGDKKNEWLQHELDLEKIFTRDKLGLYTLTLTFSEKDMLASLPDEWEDWRRYNYIYDYARLEKALILSDIGIIAKKEKDGLIIVATDLINARPLENADVKLKSYQNQTLAVGKTDVNGICRLNENEGFFVEVSKNGQRSILRFTENQLSTTLFETGGYTISSQGIKAFIYSDRGVYRPGEKIYLSVIARNNEYTFPDGHPISLYLINPLGQKVLEKNTTNGKEGFYTFEIETNENFLTGDWLANIKVGEQIFQYNLKIETFVPYQIKVDINTNIEKLTLNDKNINFTINSKYLFGVPAANFNAKAIVTIEKSDIKFKKFQDFIFYNEASAFKKIESPIFEGALDENGEMNVDWEIPEIVDAPGNLRAVINGRVFEKGGRPVINIKSIPINCYDYYVGIQAFKERYLATDTPTKFNVILVDTNGEPVPNQDIVYRIYHNKTYWWWDYDNRSEYKKHFKKDIGTTLFTSGTVKSSSKPINIQFTPKENGEYFIEVQCGDKGHIAGFFTEAYSWENGPQGEDAEILEIKTDKEKYKPGDKAKVIIHTPMNGKMFYTLEKGFNVIKKEWINLEKEETIIDVPITENMLPNAYFFAIAIQPHSQTINDRPIRLYGVVPLIVEKEDTKLNININTLKEFKPNQEFEIEINTKEKVKSQFTIAVVDEGILDITGFKTPSPWNYFFQKEKLSVISYDIFSDVIGANWGAIHKSFSLGGDEALLKRQRASNKSKTFKPVALFKGPIFSDDNGRCKVKFKMPNYVGSVKIMVVGASGKKFGSSEKIVPVKSDLMILPTLPRVLGPKEEIEIPVTIFAMSEKIGKIETFIEINDDLAEIVGDKKIEIETDKIGEFDGKFKIKTKDNIGELKIKIYAKSSKFYSESITNIAIRAASPRQYFSNIYNISNSSPLIVKIPKYGLPNAQKGKVTISKVKNLKFESRFKFLINYPYGCVEQTVSAVFPQLYMNEIFNLNSSQRSDIDQNINVGINKLRNFQLSNGSFSYWPGDQEAHRWGTTYVLHFLIEAKNKGYFVPEDLINKAIKYETEMSRIGDGQNLERAYRLYVLALCGQPDIGGMNLLKENSFKNMVNNEKWLLAAAYKLAGIEKTALEIISKTGLEVKQYTEMTGTFGSDLRDRSMILEMLILFNEKDKALKMYNEIADLLSINSYWYSTQTTAYALLSIGKYLQAYNKSSDSKLIGKIKLPDGQIIPFDTDKTSFSINVNKDFDKDIQITMESNVSAFVITEWEGVSSRDYTKKISKNLDLSISYLDENGSNINIDTLKQGTTFYAKIKVKKDASFVINELALTYILPSGWEIENLRLTGGYLPIWAENYSSKEKYCDIQDDRISWFFDMLESIDYEFLLKLNAVAIGKFYLPPTIIEAMYNNNFRAVNPGKEVVVIEKK